MAKILGSDIKRWNDSFNKDTYYFEECHWTFREYVENDEGDYDIIVETDQLYDIDDLDGYIARNDGTEDNFCKSIRTNLKNYLKSLKMTVFSVECDKSLANEIIAYLQINGCKVRR